MWPGICEASGNWTRFVCRKTEPSTCSFGGAPPCSLRAEPWEISTEHLNKTEPSICALQRKHLLDRQTRRCPCLVQTIPPLNPSASVLHGKHRTFPVTQMPGNLLPAGGASALTVAHSFLSAADRCAGSLSKVLGFPIRACSEPALMCHWPAVSHPGSALFSSKHKNSHFPSKKQRMSC